MEKEEEKTSSKLQSRKFIVWVVWLIVTICVLIFCTATMIVTHEIVESMTGLIEKTLSWFFAISMMYLGMNAGQKVGVAFADSITTKLENEDK